MTLPRIIRTPEDIARFFNHLVRKDRLVGLHPDIDFSDYGITVDDKWVRTYTEREASRRNGLMMKASMVARENLLDLWCMAKWAEVVWYGDDDPPALCNRESKYFERPPGVLDWRPT